MAMRLLAAPVDTTPPLETTGVGSTALVLSARAIRRSGSGGAHYGDGAVWSAHPSSDESLWTVYPSSGEDRLQARLKDIYATARAASGPADQHGAASQYKYYAFMLSTMPYRPSLSLYA